MATKVTEITNLTQPNSIGPEGGTSNIKLPQKKLEQFTVLKKGASVNVVAEGLTVEGMDNFAEASDNIQVTWTDNGGKTHRGVGGRWAKEDDTITISNLLDVSQYSVGLTGKLAIGEDENKAALISVSIGNLNPAREWIINFSDKQDGDKGTYIKLVALINWIKEKNKQDTQEVTYPKIKTLPAANNKAAENPDNKSKEVTNNALAENQGSTPDGAENKKPEVVEVKAVEPKDFVIEFKSFYYNITQKTFDVWVASKENESISFEGFTIKNVGFRVTNVPIPLPIEEKKVLAAPKGKSKKSARKNK
jgi:hypothetical protein